MQNESGITSDSPSISFDYSPKAQQRCECLAQEEQRATENANG